MKRRVQAFLRASRAIAEEKGKLKHCQVPGCMQCIRRLDSAAVVMGGARKDQSEVRGMTRSPGGYGANG
jgi:hypothetical protein